jgi:hypothetical protein
MEKYHQDCLKGIPHKKEEDNLSVKMVVCNGFSWRSNHGSNDNGTIGGILMYTSDITSRKIPKSNFALVKRGFRGNFENAAIGMAFIDTTRQMDEG